MTQTSGHVFDEIEGDHVLTAPTAAFRAEVGRGLYPIVPASVRAAMDYGEQLFEKFRTLYADVPPPNQLGGSLLEAMSSGQTLDDALAATLDAHQERGRLDVAAGILRQAQGQAERFLSRQITETLPEILAGLRPQLEETVAMLRQAYEDIGALDIHQPDPHDVAQAPKKQQAALITIAEATKRYRRIRRAQEKALIASDLPIPGNHPHRVTWTWADFFDTGVQEVSAPPASGLPGKGRAPRKAVRDVVTRSDVWLPDPDEMLAAYDRLQSRTTAGQAEARKQAAAAERAAQKANDAALASSLTPAAVATLDVVSMNKGGRRG